MAKKAFFITGTDTGVGKTTATVALLAAARNAGLKALAMKPLAAGCEQTPEGLRNDDALQLQRLQPGRDYEQVNPVALAPAIAPHIAAKEAGVLLTVRRLAGFTRGMLMERADICLIEGAGGWRVPLSERETLSHLPVELQTPVILVVALRLGCLNHALLTAEAIIRDGCKLAGWIGNRTSAAPMDREPENIATLNAMLPAPCLGVLSYRQDADFAALAPELDLSLLGI